MRQFVRQLGPIAGPGAACRQFPAARDWGGNLGDRTYLQVPWLRNDPLSKLADGVDVGTAGRMGGRQRSREAGAYMKRPAKTMTMTMTPN